MAAVTEVRRAIRWGLRHGLIRRAVNRRAREGDLTARLMMDQDVIADPFPHYDSLREQGRLVDNTLVLNTAHHDLSTAILRSGASVSSPLSKAAA